jgi:hypothetical protein
MVAEAVKERLRAQYRTLDPVALLAEIRAAQEELGNRIDRRAGGALRENAGGKSDMVVHSSTAQPAAFARGLGNDLARGEPRATHRRPKRRYKKRIRMPSKLDPHVALIEGWLAAEPQLTAIAPIGSLPLEWVPVVTRASVIPFEPSRRLTLIQRPLSNGCFCSPHDQNEPIARAPKHGTQHRAPFGAAATV